MKNYKYIYILLAIIGFGIVSCSENTVVTNEHNHNALEKDAHGHAHEKSENIHLSSAQMKVLKMEVGSMTPKNLSAYVESNGHLEVPPHNEALVTSIIGGNITGIRVIEGDGVKKGQVLATISHPDLIKLQTEYLDFWNQREYLKQEFDRQEKLYNEKVSSGKDYQKVKSEYMSVNSQVLGLEAQLKMLHISTVTVRDGKITEHVNIISPIEGFVRKVEVKMAQYVAPQKELFDIVNIEHVHADFMVYEKDISKVKVGQTILFKVEGNQGQEIKAEIYSVGKNFEEDPKAVHIHAEIENKEGLLLPGMYIRGKIMVENIQKMSLPEEAVVRDSDKFYVFAAFSSQHHDETEWEFVPIQIQPGITDDGWIEIIAVDQWKEGAEFALNGAYYLQAELKKEEAEHSH